MKIRTDFVTNSSSSSYIVTTVQTTNAYIEMNVFIDGGWGVFLDKTINEQDLEKELNTCSNGQEMMKIFNKYLDPEFEKWCKSNDSSGYEEVLDIEDFSEVFYVEVKETVEYDDGGKDSEWCFSCNIEYSGEPQTNKNNTPVKYKPKKEISFGEQENAEMWLEKYEKYVEKNPQVDFDGKVFVFTGLGGDERSYTYAIANAILERGGQYRERVSGKTDYLVVNPYGAGESKTNAAILQQEKGKDIKIVLLEDIEKLL